METAIGSIIGVIIATIFIVYRNKRKIRAIHALVRKGKQLEESGSPGSAYNAYSDALSRVLCLDEPDFNLAKGLVARMDAMGWEVAGLIEDVLKKKNVAVDFSELGRVVEELRDFSKNVKYVNSSGYPKNDGKAIYESLRKRLRAFHNSLPFAL